MLEKNYRFLMEEYKRERAKQQFHLQEARKALRNMMDIQTEIMNLDSV